VIVFCDRAHFEGACSIERSQGVVDQVEERLLELARAGDDFGGLARLKCCVDPREPRLRSPA
jgi:hypothetical protein